jgi:hypothetical protein
MDAGQQQRIFEKAAAQYALSEMRDASGQRPQELWQRLHNQCERAARGDTGDGISYFEMKF